MLVNILLVFVLPLTGKLRTVLDTQALSKNSFPLVVANNVWCFSYECKSKTIKLWYLVSLSGSIVCSAGIRTPLLYFWLPSHGVTSSIWNFCLPDKIIDICDFFFFLWRERSCSCQLVKLSMDHIFNKRLWGPKRIFLLACACLLPKISRDSLVDGSSNFWQEKDP